MSIDFGARPPGKLSLVSENCTYQGIWAGLS